MRKAIAIVSTSVLVITATVAVAAPTLQADGTIRMCALKSTGALRLPTGACKSTETSVMVNGTQNQQRQVNYSHTINYKGTGFAVGASSTKIAAGHWVYVTQTPKLRINSAGGSCTTLVVKASIAGATPSDSQRNPDANIAEFTVSNPANGNTYESSLENWASSVMLQSATAISWRAVCNGDLSVAVPQFSIDLKFADSFPMTYNTFS